MPLLPHNSVWARSSTQYKVDSLRSHRCRLRELLLICIFLICMFVQEFVGHDIPLVRDAAIAQLTSRPNTARSVVSPRTVGAWRALLNDTPPASKFKVHFSLLSNCSLSDWCCLLTVADQVCIPQACRRNARRAGHAACGRQLLGAYVRRRLLQAAVWAAGASRLLFDVIPVHTGAI